MTVSDQQLSQPINHITEEDLSAFQHKPMMNHYQIIATKSAFYPGQGTALGLAYVALKLNGESGEFAEHVGKAMRDDDFVVVVSVPETETGKVAPWKPIRYDVSLNQMSPERKALVVKEIGDVLWYLSAACNELGISLAEAAMGNLQKLKDRTDRDALRGSGDDR